MEPNISRLAALLVAAAAAEVTFDLRPFERDVVPRWLDRFALDFGAGRFAFRAGEKDASLYGLVDATHLLASIGRLPVDAATRGAWARRIAAFQRADGTYSVPADAPGWQPWHASGSATAALALLGGERVARPTAYCEALLAAGEAAWAAEMDASYAARCPKRALGGNDIHKCGQRVGACPAVLGAAPRAAAFVAWWRRWLADRTDPRIGVLCPAATNASAAEMQCLGGGMPTHGVLLAVDPGAALPRPRALLDFALRLQSPAGAWSDAAPDALGSLSLDGAFQASRAARQLGAAYRWDDARAACGKLLRLAAARLGNATDVLDALAATSHDLPNAVAAAAECAQTFPADVATDRAWSCCARYV